MNARAFTAKVIADLYMGTSNYWPAVSVQAANMAQSSWDPVLARTGALYIGPNMSGCRTIDPTKPPPSPVTTEIKVTAPDWDLGELERGKETTRTFATDAQRLCFAYDAKYIEYDKYLISVSNRNGVADNKFLLVSAADGSETVPYTLSFTGAARRWRCQYQWTAVDVGQERADVPDAHIQGMGRCQDQGRRFQ